MADTNTADMIKSWAPLIVLAITLVGGWFTLQNRVANAEDKIDQLQLNNNQLTEIQRELRIGKAVTERELQSISEDQAELKRLLERLLAR